MIVTPIKTRVFKEGEDLVKFIITHVPRMKNGSVLAITSKIVALAEGRTAEIKNDKAREVLIRDESDWMLKTKYVYLTLKDGMLMANAGIDDSNGNGKVILLPKDSFASAKKLRSHLLQNYKIKHLGIVITDSRTAPLRRGVTGVALGYAGFAGLKDYRDKKDLFGRKFKFASVSIADMLASAAVLTMGEGKECQPLVLIEDVPVKFSKRIQRNELLIAPKDDMYGPVFKVSQKK